MSEPNQSQQHENALEIVPLEAITRAEVDMQISTAKRWPRTISKVREDMLTFATLDEATALACFYTLPRGGKTIQGPSVRLAEIAVACYGNLRAGSRIIAAVTSGDNPHVVVQSVAHDLEKNTAVTIEKRRRIVGKKEWKNGKASGHKPIDEDDINLAVNSCSAIAFRDAVFKVVPLAIVKPVMEAAKKVAVGDVKSLVKKRGQVIDRLRQMGVTEDRILATVECRKLDDIGVDQLETLIGLGTSIRDGEVTIEDAFPDVEAAPPSTKPATADKADTDQELVATPPADGEFVLEAGPPKKPAKFTDQEQLATIVLDAGHTFDDFRSWAHHEGFIDDPDAVATFDEIPAAKAKGLVRAKASLVKSLGEFCGKGVGR